MVQICKTELEQQGRLVVRLNDIEVLVLRTNAGVFAIENLCSHANYELTEATVDDLQIICPLHGGAFCLRTGQVTQKPARKAIQTFRVLEQEQTYEILA